MLPFHCKIHWPLSHLSCAVLVKVWPHSLHTRYIQTKQDNTAQSRERLLCFSFLFYSGGVGSSKRFTATCKKSKATFEVSRWTQRRTNHRELSRLGESKEDRHNTTQQLSISFTSLRFYLNMILFHSISVLLNLWRWRHFNSFAEHTVYGTERESERERESVGCVWWCGGVRAKYDSIGLDSNLECIEWEQKGTERNRTSEVKWP